MELKMNQKKRDKAGLNRNFDYFSTEEISEILGVCQKTITNYVKKGLPKEGRNEFCASKILAWFVLRIGYLSKIERLEKRQQQREASILKKQAQTRVLHIQRELLTLKLETLKGNLIAIEEVSKLYEKNFYELRNRINSIPNRMKYELSTQSPETTGTRLLEELNSILKQHEPRNFFEQLKLNHPDKPPKS